MQMPVADWLVESERLGSGSHGDVGWDGIMGQDTTIEQQATAR